MRTFLIAAGAWLLAGAALSAPKIEFRETTFNAGTFWEGDTAGHEFVFRNTGDENLKIERVRSTCGCTAALLSRDEIAPGEEGSVKTDFNTRRYTGKQSKQVTVHSNDPANPAVQLRIECLVLTVAGLKPSALFFNNVLRGETPAEKVTLQPSAGPFNITGVEATGGFFEVLLPEDRRQVGPDNLPLEFEVRILPLAPLGKLSGNLALTTDHPRLKQLTMRIRADIRGTVDYTPRMIFFNRQDLDGLAGKVIRISKTGDPDLEVTRPETTVPGFDLALAEVKKGAEYTLTVTPVGKAQPGRKRGDIIFRTNQPDQAEIRIPISSFYPETKTATAPAPPEER